MPNIDLAYEIFGSPKNQALLILHGFFASSRNWRLIANKLADHFHVYTLDLRNHGASPHHPQMDYPAMAADVMQFLEQHKLKDVVLLGHSMGGKTAMWLALNHPGFVDKLIIADIAPITYTHTYDQTLAALKALPLATLSNRKEAELLLAPTLPELNYRQFLLQNLVLEDGKYRWRIDLDIFQQNASFIIGFPDDKALLPYAGAALFLAGADSNYLDPKDLEHLFPSAKVAVIEQADHWLHAQQPEIFVNLIKQFCALS
ncbi:MAG: alpha/beta fold hydrolase [Methylococcaceae bacterium]|jgi:pimeloyl-ACP methyl ester carboxylesterase